MKAIILSAGQGRRLLPHTESRPKCALAVAGRAILDWQLHQAALAGIDEAVVVTGFHADVVDAIVADHTALRARMVLASKGGIMPPLPYNQSAAYLASAIDASLKRLRTETIDLYQIHRPDILAHPQEVARTLDDAVKAGKRRRAS